MTELEEFVEWLKEMKKNLDLKDCDESKHEKYYGWDDYKGGTFYFDDFLNDSFKEWKPITQIAINKKMTKNKQIIGFTCGSFDLFHAGHVLMLQEVRSQCDHLIVGLQTDPTIDRPEKNKPVMSVKERAILLNGCRFVDAIVLYETEQDLLKLLEWLPISVRFLGADWQKKRFTGDELDIKILFNSRNHGFSSSELRERVKKAP